MAEDDQDRWAALARELGLDESVSQPEPPRVVTPVRTGEPKSTGEGVGASSPPPRGRRRREPEPEQEPAAPPPPLPLPSPVAENDPFAPDPSEATPEEEGAAEEPAPGSGEERRQGGRRRRRRGRGKKSAEPSSRAETVAAEPPPGNEGGHAEIWMPEAVPAQEASSEGPGPESEETPPRGRRRRGRGRKKSGAPEEAVVTEAPVAPVAVAETPASIPEDPETEDLSEWNIPSWQDLISSLYRPER